ncbi:MAG: N-acetyl-gamma-glutamyl-phosphate reductase [Flavobacteriales bacterium]|nr:N-acetyl-gamma-glutamyl-phosphate reductase [Flavobacteriales bacterium]|tara:strand:+ start:16327 stop:17304 length:978 start_codon:yes stop_codon:yes gene_type:complete
MITVGVAGGAGYTGGELLRIIINHPEVDIKYVYSTSQAGNPVYATHKDLLGETDLVFSDKLVEVDVLFLCLPHGTSKTFLEENTISESTKIIDLSTDFRHSIEEFESDKSGFVYGLPEFQKEAIKGAIKIANPGCFATGIQFALLPLAKARLIKEDIHVSAVTGSTGAGRVPTDTSHFSWRNGNISVYKQFNHQHLKEIKATLKHLQPSFNQAVNFVPFRGNFTRGILASVYTKFDGTLEEAKKLYTDYYADAPFVHFVEKGLDLKQVVNTNKCVIQVELHDGNIYIQSAIDNLLKGASGQAVQNMNLLFGLDERTGLRLKTVAF